CVRHPEKKRKATSLVGGLRPGDLVRAVGHTTSKKAGTYTGRIVVRASGACHLTTTPGTLQGIHARWCTRLQRGDGYRYETGVALPPPGRQRGVSGATTSRTHRTG